MHDFAPVILILGVLLGFPAILLWHEQRMYRIKRETEFGEPRAHPAPSAGAKPVEGLPLPEDGEHGSVGQEKPDKRGGSQPRLADQS